MIPELEVILRLLVAAGLGALVGLERERSNQAAGLRTHIVLAIGSALAMTLSISLGTQAGTDPTRLAAQVVTGVGFIGAGAIMRYGASVRGLTTATSLWTMAVVGLTVGAGLYLVACVTTAMMLVVLFVLNVVEKRLINPYFIHTIVLVADDRPNLMTELRQVVQQSGWSLGAVSVERRFRHKIIKIEASVSIRRQEPVEALVDRLSGLTGARTIKVS